MNWMRSIIFGAACCIPGLMAICGCAPKEPPYGVEYDPEWRHRRGVNKADRRGKIRNDGQADWSAAWALFPGEIAYVWHGALRSTIVAEMFAVPSVVIPLRSQPPFELIATPGMWVKKKLTPGMKLILTSPLLVVADTELAAVVSLTKMPSPGSTSVADRLFAVTVAGEPMRPIPDFPVRFTV